MKALDSRKIERKWQTKWEKARIFETDIDKKKKKFFTSFIIPYVNSDLHLGHAFTYTRTDAYARFKRMQGFNVLLASAFHATGEPILGAIERLKKNDKTQIETFKLYGLTDEDMKDFIKKGPQYVAQFWAKRITKTMNLIGYSVDWRRQFILSVTPAFSRFIEWQYNTLKKKGYVVQGTHPVVWCPHDQSPTGDHDRLKGEGESPIEYTLLKFKLQSGEILPCGTLRPETVFGVTNLWVKKDVEYVGVRMREETWIVSEKAAEKLRDQLRGIKIIQKIKAEELIGKYAENLVTKEKVLILPADFVDPDAATGIVMSVPSHAPYDYIALKELQKNADQLKDYGIDPILLRNIKPISVIRAEGFGQHPAVEVSEKMKIQSQKETDKLNKATEEVYKKEYHTGILKENTQQYSGRKVSDVKETLIRDLIVLNAADSLWEITGEVICRCTNKCHVKILENQWFLKFSDEQWKQKVRNAISAMKFYPEEVRIQFENTVEWLKDKACTRKGGLGTRLPWDKEWIVETLSDSTIYMAYYTIARIINEKKIPAEKLTDEVFDHIFLGRGSLKNVSKKSKLNGKIIKEMRDEFEYFYPLDLRNSGKDLVQNHLTFFIFHHAAIWDESRFWPKAISVNGFVQVSGEKMAKSKGNLIPLMNLIEETGVDLARINIVASNEGMDDADWRDESLSGYKSRIEFLINSVENLKKAKVAKVRRIDSYMSSRLNEIIMKSTEDFENLRYRSAVQSCLFELTNEMKWYVERVGGFSNCNRNVLKDSLISAVKMISPITPHICEEMWSKMNQKGFVAISDWPVAGKKINKESIQLETILKKTVEDLKHVISLVGKKKSAYLYVVTNKEFEHLKDAKEYIRKNFGFKRLEIFKVDNKKKYDPQNKSSKAKFGKPGIYLE